jgi:hypothetical protein
MSKALEEDALRLATLALFESEPESSSLRVEDRTPFDAA